MIYRVKIKYNSGYYRCFNKKFSSDKTRAEYKAKKLSNKEIDSIEITIGGITKKRPSNYNVSLEKQIIAKKRNLVSASCIYALIKGDKVVYIGQSDSPMGRLQYHINSNKDFDSYAIVEWVATGNTDYINNVEKKYIKELRPLYNKVHNN